MPSANLADEVITPAPAPHDRGRRGRGRGLGGGGRNRTGHHTDGEIPPPPDPEELHRMFKGTAVGGGSSRGGSGSGDDGGGGTENGGGGLDDSFVRGLWGSGGDPTAGLSSLAIETDGAAAAAEGDGDNVPVQQEPTLIAPVWKRRAGLGGKFAAATRREWERRRLELVGTKLRYYCLDPEEESDEGDDGAEDSAGETTEATYGDADEAGRQRSSSIWSENGVSVTISTVDDAGPPQNAPPAPPSAPSSARSTPAVSTTPSQRKKPPPSPSWVPHVSFGTNASEHNNSDPTVPRGELDLSNEEYTVELTEEDEEESEGNVHLPTPHVLKILKHGGEHVAWKICLDSATSLDEWALALKAAMGEERVEVSSNGPGQSHGFAAGDHVIRWEVLVVPIAYPIQIHGIVLEAGRNCVIIADFGLTSYGKNKVDKKDTGEGGEQGGEGSGAAAAAGTSAQAYDVSTSDEDKEKEHHSVVMDHWKKLRPNQLQRLNVIAYTDERDIRKWKKVNYGETGEGGATPKAGKKKKFGLFRAKSSDDGDSNKAKQAARTSRRSSGASVLREGSQLEGRISGTSTEQEGTEEYIEEGDFAGVSRKREGGTDASEDGNAVAASAAQVRTMSEEGPKAAANGDEPSWFDGHASVTENRPRVFSLDSPSASGANKRGSDPSSGPKLPKTDPSKIVLARTNFLLEFGDKVLPPYHVFHSNSECIAVWCKTGRWSTLQTSIFLASCAIGNTKSGVVMTMGVAAAHVFLLPVAALGGIAAATAPWVILKKSKEKWESATMSLTEKFWAWAPHEVYVEAILHWSSLR